MCRTAIGGIDTYDQDFSGHGGRSDVQDGLDDVDGGGRDLLMTGGVRVVTVVREVVRLVVRIVGPLERGSQVHVGGAGGRRDRHDGLVHGGGQVGGRRHVRIALGRGVGAAQPDAPVVQEHDEDGMPGGQLVHAVDDRPEVLLDGRDLRGVAVERRAAGGGAGDVVGADLDLDGVCGGH